MHLVVCLALWETLYLDLAHALDVSPCRRPRKTCIDRSRWAESLYEAAGNTPCVGSICASTIEPISPTDSMNPGGSTTTTHEAFSDALRAKSGITLPTFCKANVRHQRTLLLGEAL
jgi:hypothetical protein